MASKANGEAQVGLKEILRKHWHAPIFPGQAARIGPSSTHKTAAWAYMVFGSGIPAKRNTHIGPSCKCSSLADEPKLACNSPKKSRRSTGMAHFMHCHIQVSSSHWPTKYATDPCTRLPCGPM